MNKKIILIPVIIIALLVLTSEDVSFFDNDDMVNQENIEVDLQKVEFNNELAKEQDIRDILMQYDSSLTDKIIIENSESRTIIDEIFDAPDYVEKLEITDSSGNVSGEIDVLVYVDEIEPVIITEKKELSLTRTLTFNDGTQNTETVNSNPNLVAFDLVAIDGFSRDITNGNVKFELSVLGNPDDNRTMLVEGEVTIIYNGIIIDNVKMSNFTSNTLNASQDNQILSATYSIKDLKLIEGSYPLEFRLDKLIILYDDYTNEQSQPYQSLYKINIEKNKNETIIQNGEWSFQRTFDYDVPVKISANQSLLEANYCMGVQRGNSNCGKVMVVEAIVPAPALGKIKVTEIKPNGNIKIIAEKEARNAGECTNPSGEFRSRSGGAFSGIDFDLCSSQQGYDYKTELLYGDSREKVQSASSNYSIFDKITKGGGSLGFTAQYGSSYRIEISDPPKDFIIDIPVTVGEISYSCVYDKNMIRVCDFP